MGSADDAPRSTIRRFLGRADPALSAGPIMIRKLRARDVEEPQSGAQQEIRLQIRHVVCFSQKPSLIRCTPAQTLTLASRRADAVNC